MATLTPAEAAQLHALQVAAMPTMGPQGGVQKAQWAVSDFLNQVNTKDAAMSDYDNLYDPYRYALAALTGWAPAKTLTLEDIRKPYGIGEGVLTARRAELDTSMPGMAKQRQARVLATQQAQQRYMDANPAQRTPNAAGFGFIPNPEEAMENMIAKRRTRMRKQ